MGYPLNAPTILYITPEGERVVHTPARFSSRSLQPPLYYRLGWEREIGEWGWGVELVHHKLFLTNTTDRIQRFDISHGFNILSLYRGRKLTPHFWRREGLGAVIAHPENRVDGQDISQNRGLMGSGYYLSGPALLLGVGRNDKIIGSTIIKMNLDLIFAYAWVPLYQGYATFPHLSLHLSLGMGYIIRK